MKTKVQKKESIDALATTLPDASITIFTTFARGGEQGLSVAQLQELKRALRSVESEYVVAKKTLVDKALQQLKYDGVDVFGMDGSMGLVLAHGDVYAAAKQLYQFAKANPALKLFAAWTDGHAISLAELTDMATLPSREELIARLLGMLQYPVKSLAIVLDQVAKNKTAAAPAAPEAPAPAAEPVVEPAAEPTVTEPAAEAAAPAEEVATS
ncbi:MAG: 50S ribosomal protein L10 [Candidatus Yanofskybacteria bacterium]|nr:50S ribosomal protein L10 [Candidatus Yanofskybacteria bacterium]